MSACRVCNSYTPSQMIHYSVRHYAHLECALTKWGAQFFTRLGTWTLSRLPSSNMKALFVGERRSPRAVDMGVTWQDKRLASATLHAAFKACGYRGRPAFANAFDPWDFPTIYHWRGPVIAMGERAQGQLTAWSIAFIPTVHPAARGRIRVKAVYQQHVAETLKLAGLIP